MQLNLSSEPLVKFKSHGDFVERHLADRIQAVTPSYIRFWAEYIGNDGKAQALPMPDTGKDADDSRAKYWQRIYTMLESMAICWDIEDELHQIKEVKSFKIYVKNLNLWMAFYAHIGRIRDMVKTTAGELGTDQLLKPFNDYWQARNIVLHGPKVPMSRVYNVLAVPSFGQSPGNWNDKMVWSQLEICDFEFIADGVSSILRGLELQLDRHFAQLHKILPDRFGWRPVVWGTLLEKTEGKSLIVKVGNYTSDPFGIDTLASGTGLCSGTYNISSSNIPDD